MSSIVGLDILEYYRARSRGSGYLRLNRKLKVDLFAKMKAECDRLGLRLYVSDAHGKEFSYHGSCCGLPPSWNYSKGQFTEALMIAKRTGSVRFSDIEQAIEPVKDVPWVGADGFNTGTSEKRCRFTEFTFYDWFRYHWNHTELGNSPYRYFGGALKPVSLDERGDVVYEYDGVAERGEPACTGCALMGVCDATGNTGTTKTE